MAVVSHYFDDYLCVEPGYLHNTGHMVLELLHQITGLPLAPQKHVAMAPHVIFLGVASDLSTLASVALSRLKSSPVGLRR